LPISCGLSTTWNLEAQSKKNYCSSLKFGRKDKKPNMSQIYAEYQTKIYSDGGATNIVPTVTTDPRKLEARAEKALGSRSFGYVAGGIGMRTTMEANRSAFNQWKLYVRPFVRQNNPAK
jgi:hypothetical protein